MFESRLTECLSEPKVYDLRAKEVERVQELLAPRTWLMSHDEMRVMNWCETCRGRNMTPGQLLADNVRRCAELIHKVRPDATIAVWSDMFDPLHNVRENYYFVNGPLRGSANGLSKDVLIVNWNHQATKQSVAWFAARGHPQVIAGYYDRDLRDERRWVESVRDLPGVEGVMFTTWKRDFTNLEKFALFAWGRQ